MQVELKKEDHANISENWTDGTMLYLLMPTGNTKRAKSNALFKQKIWHMLWSNRVDSIFGKHGWNFVLLSHFLKLYQIIALFLHQAIIWSVLMLPHTAITSLMNFCGTWWSKLCTDVYECLHSRNLVFREVQFDWDEQNLESLNH